MKTSSLEIRGVVIGGTSLLAHHMFQDGVRVEVVTHHGKVTFLHEKGILFLQRHGMDSYRPPHRIRHLAHFEALRQLKVPAILALGSVGSLRRDLTPGTFVIPHDFIAPGIAPTFFKDDQGHVAPAFHAKWRKTLVQAVEKLSLPALQPHGVYWQTTGPRFETPAEIRLFMDHAHVVGMSIASECILAGEAGLPYAALCLVDNLANGLSDQPLDYESFKKQAKSNYKRILHTLEGLLPQLFPVPKLD